MMRQISATIRYLCFGVLFGALFPIGATCLDIGLRGGPWSLATVGLVQAAQPLHWLIDTAPVFLGLFAAIAGWQQEKLERINAVLVTQRNAQHDAEVQFQTVVSNIPGGVYRSSTSDGWPMIFVSPVIETITGYPSNDFLQNGVRTFASIIHPDDLAMTEAVSLEALRLRQSFAIEYRIIRADGQIAWIFEKGQGVYDDTGTARWIDGVIFDDTERRQSAELLQQANQQRVAAQAAIIAELSTP